VDTEGAVVKFLRIAIAIGGSIRYNRKDNRVFIRVGRKPCSFDGSEVETNYGIC
jgi:hypothetical protein